MATFATRFALLAAVACAFPAYGTSIAIYGTEADFQGAAAGAVLSVEGFNQPQQQNGQTDRTFGDIRVQSDKFTVSKQPEFVSEGTTAIKAVPGGWSDYGPVTFSFDSPINFLGLDVLDLGSSKGTSTLMVSLDGGAPIELLSAGQPWPEGKCVNGGIRNNGCYNNAFEGGILFAGLYSDSSFSTITFTIADLYNGAGSYVLDDYVGFDRFQYGAGQLTPGPAMRDSLAAIPEPATISLLGLCLAALRVRRVLWAA